MPIFFRAIYANLQHLSPFPPFFQELCALSVHTGALHAILQVQWEHGSICASPPKLCRGCNSHYPWPLAKLISIISLFEIQDGYKGKSETILRYLLNQPKIHASHCFQQWPAKCLWEAHKWSVKATAFPCCWSAGSGIQRHITCEGGSCIQFLWLITLNGPSRCPVSLIFFSKSLQN